MKYLVLARSTLFLLCFFVAGTAFAGNGDRFSGWAWSENTGWISFNCTNTTSCGTSDYGVTAATTGFPRAVTGWAWSDNLGWIDFSNATYDSGAGSLGGTALVYSTTQSPYRSGDSDDDGWDGVIDLSGIAVSPFGPVTDITDDTADGWDWPDNAVDMFDGFSWGDENMGWIKFSCQDSDGFGPDVNSCGTVGFGVFLDPIVLDFTADKGLTLLDAVVYEDPYNHSWTAEPVANVLSCTGSGGPVDSTWDLVPGKSFSPPPVTEQVNGSTDSGTSTLSCDTTTGKTVTKNLMIYVAPPEPEITFDADDNNIPYNTATTLRWTTEHADACTLSGPVTGVPPYSNTPVATGTDVTITSGLLVDLDNDFILKCTSPHVEYTGLEFLATELVHVEKLIFDFYAEDDEGNRLTDQELVAYTEREEIKLVWDLEFATGGCTATGDWTGAKANADGRNEEIAPIPDSGTFSYTLGCNGTNGQYEEGTVTIKVTRNPDFSEEITNSF